MDSYKTELIADRVWRTRSQLELATVEWVAWFNNQRLHEALGDIPPIEFEQRHSLEVALNAPIPDIGSVAGGFPSAADGLTTRRSETGGVATGLKPLLRSQNGSELQTLLARTAPQVADRRTPAPGLSEQVG